MKIEITKDAIQDLIAVVGKEQAIKELHEIVNVLILEAVNEIIKQ